MWLAIQLLAPRVLASVASLAVWAKEISRRYALSVPRSSLSAAPFVERSAISFLSTTAWAGVHRTVIKFPRLASLSQASIASTAMRCLGPSLDPSV